MPNDKLEVSYVIDSGALLTYLEGVERGSIVERVLRQCRDSSETVAISGMDISGVYAKVAYAAPPLLEELASIIDQLPLTVEPLGNAEALAAAEIIRNNTEISMIESVPLALAQSKGSVLITNNPSLARLTKSIYVGEQTNT
jgi:predicted nucleic acid-binding protein